MLPSGNLLVSHMFALSLCEYCISASREVLLDALSVLGTPGHGIAKSEGAIYLWARLPAGIVLNTLFAKGHLLDEAYS